MDNQEPDMQKIAQALYGYAAQRMKNGASDAQIVGELKEKGLNEELARTIVSKLRPVHTEARHTAGRKNMIFGALWCVGGLIATLVGMSAGGGYFIIFWGAIIFGAAQFIRGAVLYFGGGAGGTRTAAPDQFRSASTGESRTEHGTTEDGEKSSSVTGNEAASRPAFAGLTERVDGNTGTAFRPDVSGLAGSAGILAGREPRFIKWISLPETARHEIMAGLAGPGRALAFSPFTLVRFVLRRLPLLMMSAVTGLIWYGGRLGNAAYSPLDLVILSLACAGLFLSMGVIVADLVRLNRLSVKPGRYLFPSCVVEAGPVGMKVHPLTGALSVSRHPGRSTGITRLAVSFPQKTFSFDVRTEAAQETCDAINTLRRTGSAPDSGGPMEERFRSDPFVRYSLLDGNTAAYASPAEKRAQAGFPLLPVTAAAALLLAAGAGYALWTSFNRASDGIMFARLREAPSTPAYREYLSRGGRQTISASDLQKGDAALAAARFAEVKARQSVKAWREYLKENEDVSREKAAREEMAGLYEKALNKLVETVPENKQLAGFFRSLFSYFQEKGVSTLPVRFNPPSQTKLELTDKLVAALSELDAKIAPVAPCFERGDDWLDHGGTVRRLNMGLTRVLPFDTVEAVYDESDQAAAGVPMIAVDCLLVPNGSVYSGSGRGGSRSSAYKYFAGFDINVTLTFKRTAEDPGYSCELEVSPPDQFVTQSLGGRSSIGITAVTIYRRMISLSYQGVSDKILESVFGLPADSSRDPQMAEIDDTLERVD